MTDITITDQDEKAAMNCLYEVCLNREYFQYIGNGLRKRHPT